MKQISLLELLVLTQSAETRAALPRDDAQRRRHLEYLKRHFYRPQ